MDRIRTIPNTSLFEYDPNLHPNIRGDNHMKVRCNYCGTISKVPIPLIFLKLLTSGKVYHKCQKCHMVSAYLISLRLVHDSTDEKEKECRKLLR